MPVSRKKITEGQGNCNCLIVLLDCFPLTFFLKKNLELPQHFSVDALLTHTKLLQVEGSTVLSALH